MSTTKIPALPRLAGRGLMGIDKEDEKMKYTKKDAEEDLNDMGCPDRDHPENGGRVSWRMINKYGTWLRKHDPIAFEVNRQERQQEMNSLQHLKLG